MALSQLITTIDIANSNVGINNAVSGTTNAVALGNGQNVGIGTTTPLCGVHIGNSGNTVPALYVKDATSATLPTIAAGDGVFSSVAGNPTFTNASGAKTLFSVSSESIGTGTLVAGTVTINSAIVTTSSAIFITKTTTSGAVNTEGTLKAVAGTGSFVVSSTVATDVSDFNYLIINV